MFTNPKENRTQTTCNLSEQFRQKGYQCLSVREEDSTILILTHEKNRHDSLLQATENYKHLLKQN